jgi:RNA polymerase sigma-70 factor (ECF subfamily)
MFVAATVFRDNGIFPGEALHRWRLLPTKANGGPAFAIYQRDENNEYQPFGLIALILDKDKLSQIISFIDPTLPHLFGLPAKLEQP